MNEIENYHLLEQGDIIRLEDSLGIVVEILEHGQVQVFWPLTNKVSKHGKKWAELHLEVIEHG